MTSPLQQPQDPPKQTIYPHVRISVGEVGPGRRAIVIDTPTDGQLVFPVDMNACKQLGSALVAPGIHLPDNNQPH